MGISQDNYKAAISINYNVTFFRSNLRKSNQEIGLSYSNMGFEYAARAPSCINFDSLSKIWGLSQTLHHSLSNHKC